MRYNKYGASVLKKRVHNGGNFSSLYSICEVVYEDEKRCYSNKGYGQVAWIL